MMIQLFEKLLKNLDINPKTFLMEATDIKIKEELKKRTDDALQKRYFWFAVLLYS